MPEGPPDRRRAPPRTPLAAGRWGDRDRVATGGDGRPRPLRPGRHAALARAPGGDGGARSGGAGPPAGRPVPGPAALPGWRAASRIRFGWPFRPAPGLARPALSARPWSWRAQLASPAPGPGPGQPSPWPRAHG